MCVHACLCARASSSWPQCSRDPLLVTLSYYLMQWGLYGSGWSGSLDDVASCWCSRDVVVGVARLGVYDYPCYSMVQNVISPMTLGWLIELFHQRDGWKQGFM